MAAGRPLTGGVSPGGKSEDGVCLVWGAFGFIGQHLTRHLLDAGVHVRVLCRSKPDLVVPDWAEQVEIFSFDSISSFEGAVRRALDGAAVVYAFAGSSGAVLSNRKPLESLTDNCEVQLRFLAACAELKSVPHVVFPSSRLVYGPTGKMVVSEEHLPNPQSMYAVHKVCVEQYLEVASYQGHITYTICRITNPYGYDPSANGGSYKILNYFVSNALAGKPITLFGDGSQLRDFIHISDVVERLAACRHAAARNQVLNIATGVSRTLREAAETICDITGAGLEFEPWPADYLAVESGDFVCSVNKADITLGPHTPKGLRTGLEETVETYRRAGAGALSTSLKRNNTARHNYVVR
ncbi:MAG: NAD-dependent epimerase/dehydratase family protein [Acidobacteria bacterium]|nr:NAD-dependent epimerase/dehydratase family protein [Acidobacteriota bacterium]